MTPDLEKYYESRFEMFASSGWKDLIDDIKKIKANTDKLSGVTVDNLRFKQGELSIIDWLINLESLSEDTYQQLKGNDEGIA